MYGSWAAQYPGEPGAAPGGIDVLVVGHPDRGAVDTSLEGLETQLGREVNVTYLSPDRWRAGDDPFVTTIRARRLVELRVAGRAEEVAS